MSQPMKGPQTTSHDQFGSEIQEFGPKVRLGHYLSWLTEIRVPSFAEVDVLKLRGLQLSLALSQVAASWSMAASMRKTAASASEAAERNGMVPGLQGAKGVDRLSSSRHHLPSAKLGSNIRRSASRQARRWAMT